MAWVKLDDDFFSNPKILRAGRDGRDLYLAGLCFCNRGLTDGFIPSESLRRLAADADVDDPAGIAGRLVAVGLWTAVDGGFQIHQYLDYQPSAETVRQKREAAAERMRTLRSREVRANNEDSSREVRPTPTRTQPVPVPVPTPEPDPAALGADAPAPARARAKGRPSRIDPTWEPDEPLRSWCATKQFGPVEVAEQVERFRDHYLAKGEARADWNASFRNWMTSPIRAQERTGPPARASPNGRATVLDEAAALRRAWGSEAPEAMETTWTERR